MKLKHTLTTLAALACFGIGAAQAQNTTAGTAAARSDVKADTQDAVKAGSIPQGPKSTPNQDKGGTAGMASGTDPAAATAKPMTKDHSKKMHKDAMHKDSAHKGAMSRSDMNSMEATSAGSSNHPSDTSGTTPRPGVSDKMGVGASGEGPSPAGTASPTSTPRKGGY